jgi:imidazolonepropionase-like amidohydrolase
MSLLKNSTLIVGDGTVRKETDIQLDAGRIRQIGKNIQDNEVISEGKTVLPGFIDAHVHLMLSGQKNQYEAVKRSDEYLSICAYQNAWETLQAGFTTLCDKGARNFITFGLKEAIEEGRVTGPRILACGRLICMTGGHGYWLGGREADGVDECRKAVREQLNNGADVIKVMATGGVLTKGSDPLAYQLNVEEMQAITEEAHKAGKKVSAHALNPAGISNAVHAGIDMIDHASLGDSDSIELMADNDVSWVTTIIAATQNVRKPVEKWVKEKGRKNLERKAKIMEYAKQYGVKIVLGTDAGTPFNPHGENAEEFIQLNKYGLSNMEAIVAGTRSAAEALGIGKDLGTIEEGKLADLVVVEGDPLTDISILLDSIVMVIKEGVVVVDRANN